jgi:hypothetical protein
MSKCKACENIYRKPGVSISRCGARLNPIEVEKVKEEIKKPVSRFSRKIEKSEIEIIEEDNSNE